MKKQLITDFINTNNRAPSLVELRELENEYAAKLIDIENIGEAVQVIELKRFQSNIDKDTLNKEAELIHADYMTVKEGLDYYSDKLIATGSSVLNLIKYLSARLERADLAIDTAILSLNGLDEFIRYGVEDFYDIAHYVDGNVDINNAVCTSRKVRNSPQVLSGLRVSVNHIANKAYSNVIVTGNLDDVQSVNSDFNYTVVTSARDNLINFIVQLDFDILTAIDSFNFFALPLIGLNSCFYTVFISYDKQNYESLEPVSIPLDQEANLVQINKSVKSIRIVFTKNGPDDFVNNEYYYMFNFKNIVFLNNVFAANDQSYGVFQVNLVSPSGDGSEGYAISKVTVDSCEVNPPGASTKWYVGTSSSGPWQQIDPGNENNNVVLLGYQDPTGTYNLVDNTFTEFDLLNAYEYSYPLPDYIKLHNIVIDNNSFPRETLKLYRNLHQVGRNVNGISSGWVFNNILNGYETNFVVEQKVTIDFGPYGCKINNRLVAGKIILLPGNYHFFTDASNYIDVDSGILDEETFTQEDIMFPYNHKLLIEGYNYDLDYIGERVYTGFSLVYAEDYKQKNIEDLIVGEKGFAVLPTLNDKINILVNPGNQLTWTNETWKLSWKSFRNEAASSSDSSVYVKVILTNSSEAKTPVIKWFRVRGI